MKFDKIPLSEMEFRFIDRVPAEDADVLRKALLIMDSMLTNKKGKNVIEQTEELLVYYPMLFAEEKTACLAVSFFDASRNMICTEKMSIGDVNRIEVYPRLIARRCLELNAVSVTTAYNRLSGTTEPQKCDFDVANKIKKCLDCLDIIFDNYFIASVGGCESLRERGLL